MSKFPSVRANSGFSCPSYSAPAKQRGVALVVALVLLVLVTLVGLAAIRGTTMQQKMTANFYDREVAFQSAEAALRAAASIVAATPNAAFIYDCSPGSPNVCLSNPFTDPNPVVQTVPTGAAAGQFTVSDVSAGYQPQFIVENMGVFADPTINPSALVTSNQLQYDEGVGSGGTTAGAAQSTYFLITARSGDPAAIGDRSVVTLQAMIKQ